MAKINIVDHIVRRNKYCHRIHSTNFGWRKYCSCSAPRITNDDDVDDGDQTTNININIIKSLHFAHSLHEHMLFRDETNETNIII